jgi:hypothetical protein
MSEIGIFQQLSVWTALKYKRASLGGQTGNVRGGLRHATGRGFVKRPTLFQVLSATAFTVVLICPALAPQGTKMAPDAKTITIVGAVRDLACPVQNPAGTAKSFSLQCTLDCVKHGSPIVILTKTGLIYFPISAYMPDSDQREKMTPFVGKYVQATGPVFTRNGTHAIAITQIKELKSVHVATDAR